MFGIKSFRIKRSIRRLKSMQEDRLHQPPNQVKLKKEIAVYKKLARIYRGLIGRKKWPFAQLQAECCYRAAAGLNDADSLYIFGKKSLEEAIFRQKIQSDIIFESESNMRRIQELYTEAHQYLMAAVAQKPIQAKRLLGLSYINGWGVEIDKDKGFDLIVASIEEENSWPRVQKVFAEIGINQSEFFSELFQHRTQRRSHQTSSFK